MSLITHDSLKHFAWQQEFIGKRMTDFLFIQFRVYIQYKMPQFMSQSKAFALRIVITVDSDEVIFSVNNTTNPIKVRMAINLYHLDSFTFEQID